MHHIGGTRETGLDEDDDEEGEEEGTPRQLTNPLS